MIYLFERVILVRTLEESILLQNTKFIQFTFLFFRACCFEKFILWLLLCDTLFSITGFVYEYTGKFSSFRPITDA